MKYRLSFYLSLLAAACTAFFCLQSGIGLTALVYRALVSFILFGACGLFISFSIGKFLHNKLNGGREKGQTIDITAKDEDVVSSETNTFRPLDADLYEQLSSQK